MDHVALSSHCASPPRPGTRNPVERTWNLRKPAPTAPGSNPADRPRPDPGPAGTPDRGSVVVLAGAAPGSSRAPTPPRPSRVPPPALPPSTTGAPVPPVPAGSTRSSDDPRERVLTREIVYQGYDLADHPTISAPTRRSRGPGRRPRAGAHPVCRPPPAKPTRTVKSAPTSGRGPARARRRAAGRGDHPYHPGENLHGRVDETPSLTTRARFTSSRPNSVSTARGARRSRAGAGSVSGVRARGGRSRFA